MDGMSARNGALKLTGALTSTCVVERVLLVCFVFGLVVVVVGFCAVIPIIPDLEEEAEEDLTTKGA